MADGMGFAPDAPIRSQRFRIGCVGAGFIMADVQLAAYAGAGFPVVAIASRTSAKAAEAAARWNIPTVHHSPEALIEDAEVEILDLAFPPDQQPGLIRHAPRRPLATQAGMTPATRRSPGGLIALSMEHVGAGPARGGGGEDIYIKWRVEGPKGLATGTIGWPDYPAGSPSTLRYAAQSTGGA